MFELFIAGNNVAEWVTGFTVDSAPASDKSDNSFTNYDGSKAYGNGGSIVKLDIRLGRVPTSISMALASAVESGEVEVSYTSPSPTSAKFVKKRYQASVRSKGTAWDISLSLESAAPVGGDCL